MSLATDTPGSYAYVVRDAAGQDLARVSYEVAGAANLTLSLEKNAELQVKLSKKDFSAGEETLELRLFEEAEIPWNEIAFAAVRNTLQHYFEDRRKGSFPFHMGTIEAVKA